ncbi:MAG: bifunctional diaminohydroxyphosphoribosylaminopyrimidine deaminase/5-amino-6-(5-phosphoribosylamino)uracil reductase RibD [Acetobacteraceae bacterium]
MTEQHNMAAPAHGASSDDAPLALGAIADAFDAAITEAARFMGATAPNPPVGCALLDRQGQILAIAAHQQAGQAHAERKALDLARASGKFEKIHTAIVTLEPCNHFGHTPPCAKALLASPVNHVWIGAEDPNALARGGADALRAAPNGINVRFAREEPTLAPQASRAIALSAPFSKVQRAGRCFITIKQALDHVGFMRPPPGQKTFTSPSSLTLAHYLRRATDAIITGAGTILSDKPLFTVRHVPDHPMRRRILAICDRRGVIGPDIREFYEQHGFETWVSHDLTELPAQLAKAGALWALVEGGPRLTTACESLNLWDEWLTIRTAPGREDEVHLRAPDASPTALLPPFFAPSTVAPAQSP